jgi:hypothetical protein
LSRTAKPETGDAVAASADAVDDDED